MITRYGVAESRTHQNPDRGELKALDSLEFRDPAGIDVVGIFPDYASAERAWRGKAQTTVDSALTRYFIVHLHRYLDPAGLKRKPS